VQFKPSTSRLAKYVLVFLLALLADVVASVHVYSLAKAWLAVAVVTGFTIPFVNLLGTVWFIEARTFSERVALTFSSALGVALGTGATLFWLAR